MSLGAWLRLPTLPPPPPPPLTQFAESPKQLGTRRAWLWRAALALFVLIPLLAELPQAAAQTPTVPTLKVEIPTVTEGETGTVTLTLSQPSTRPIDISISSLACSGACPQGTDPAASSDYSLPVETITFLTGETMKIASFTTTDDSATELTEVFVLAVTALDTATEATIDPSTPPDLTGIGAGGWFVRIQDNDNPANPNITITPGTSPVTEGTAATFTVTATPAPTAATTVSVAVTEETSGGQDFVALSNEATHTVSIPASGSSNAGTATLSIATEDDGTQELHGAVTATVSDGTGYTVGNPSSASVTVYDDDGTPLPPGQEVTVWIRGSVTVDVCELNGSGVPDSVCESDNNSPERKSCEAAWTPAWAKPGAVARAQVSQADINAARASVAAICGYNASATYVQERHGRDEITVTEGAAAGEITVGLSKKLGAGETVTVPLTASGVANADYAIALRTGAGLNTGVALNTSNPYSAARPAVVFTGHATDEVQFASLNVSGVSDSANEGSETLTLGIGTVTNTNLTAGTQLHSSFQTARVRIKDAGSPALAAPAPTESVVNVQVTAVDDASVSVTWDAVEHATSYEVSWSAESSDSLSAIAGTLPSVSGTSATILHDASEPMTLTVTVTPEYVDKNGDTKQVSNLSGTATLDLGPVGQDAQAEAAQAMATPPPNCVSESLLNKVRHYYDINKHRAPGHGKNWRRVLLAFGDLSDTNLTPFTAAEAKVRESRWFGWKPVRVALECIEAG